MGIEEMMAMERTGHHRHDRYNRSRRLHWVGWVGVLGALCIATSAAAPDPDRAGQGEELRVVPASSRPAWEYAIAWLTEQRGDWIADLEIAHTALLRRARLEDEALAERLSPTPPKPRPTGYGILPEIQPNQEFRAIAPGKQAYSIESLTTDFAAAIRDASLLRQRGLEEEGASLEPLVEEYERLRSRLRNFEDHISYHEMWQPEVVERAKFFAGQNAIHATAGEWFRLLSAGGDSARCASLQSEIVDAVAPFRPTAGLVVELREDGSRVLTVRVLTDIVDIADIADVAEAGLLEQFRDGVVEAYSNSEAAQARGFRVEVVFEQMSPAALYPEGAPARGTLIDAASHADRFPSGSLVLTTGGARTHAMVGRYIQLGSEKRSQRSLAHEFGHLIGFGDAYLRAYEGDPAGPFGCTLIEWTGLQDDLMGSPAHGRVTGAMVDRLLEAYSGPPGGASE